MSLTWTSTRTVVGALFVAIGALVLLHTTGVSEIGAVLRWIPSVFIVLGIWKLVECGFRRIQGPVIMIAVAAIIQALTLGVNSTVILPAALIAVGVVILLGRGRGVRDESPDGEDGELNISAIFGTTSRRVYSGDFQGGEVTTFAGETNLDLREVSLSGMSSSIDITCIMGQVTLRVPSDWDIRIDNATLLGESKDDRHLQNSPSEANLTVTGMVLMGSLKIDD